MLIATKFEILRNIKADGKISIALERKPLRVATLVDENAFNETGHAVIHHTTVFLEDFGHDWYWENGKFRYFTRVAHEADVLIVYEEMADKRTPFCTECGTSIRYGCEHQR